MKKILGISLLLLSSSVLASNGGGNGGSLGGNPGAASGAVNAKIAVCLDGSGEQIPGSYQTKLDRKCKLTGHDMIDLINYNNFYRNKPNGESLSDIRAMR
ncbi:MULTISPECIES: hypothetical protein [Photobacterium]|jgi:hypothetical protein|uniref:Uncharacterized protein n=1 Tax=Photobacterium alginatilyticum TaxID=1775171 RepID=A0ABW9YQ90_9GAMM|nr:MULTISPECIES: hypothetical protein [Photobacterium]MCG7585901.1 hypothetical protein [Photobacterium sp. OFAV2-7]NBI55845.1 hypothetical protein [Photobacterium alginatilyticum]